MATIVLSAVGTVLGGPIGGAIGGLIGNVIDNEVLFKPKGREGVRLSDLQLQTSSSSHCSGAPTTSPSPPTTISTSPRPLTTTPPTPI